MLSEMAKAAGIIESQLTNYLAETQRADVKSTADVTEEMIADSMQEILNRVARKDKNLIERFFAWLKDTFQKFKNMFKNPKGKLTRGQYAKMADVFGKMAVKLTDAEGNKIFRYIYAIPVTKAQNFLDTAKVTSTLTTSTDTSSSRIICRKILATKNITFQLKTALKKF